MHVLSILCSRGGLERAVKLLFIFLLVYTNHTQSWASVTFSHLYIVHFYNFHPNPLCSLSFASSSHQSPSSFCPDPLLLSYFNMRGTTCATPWLWRSEGDHKSVLILHPVSKESLSLAPRFGDILLSAPPIFHMCAMVSVFCPLKLGW